MGPQCHGLRVLLRVSSLDEGIKSGDHEATWLLGHTERLDFGDLWLDEGELYVDALLRVPCRHLARNGSGAECRAHGFRGPVPRPPLDLWPQIGRRQGEDRFVLVERAREVERTLPPSPERTPRALPVVSNGNPCATAACRTADNRRGAACCRDLQIEIMCTTRERRLEALIRARKPPYLCKINRESKFSLGAELISACEYLLDDGIHCALHGRLRPDGRPAKPDLCSKWPDDAEVSHPGCVLVRA